MGIRKAYHIVTHTLHLRGNLTRAAGSTLPVVSTDITDSGATGRGLLTAPTAVEARTALGTPEGTAVANVAGANASGTYDAATQATITETKTQLNALLASLRANNTIN